MKSSHSQCQTLRRMAARALSLPLAITLLAAIPLLASAATFTWDGGGTTNDWSDANNWVGNVAPDNNGTADIVFSGSLRPTSNVGTAWSVNTITFQNSALTFSLTGSALTVQGAGGINNTTQVVQTIGNALTLTTAQTWSNSNATGKLVINGNVSSNVNITSQPGAGEVVINGVVSGTGLLRKDFAGTLVLNNLNTNTGSTPRIFNGTVLVGANSPSGAAGAFGNSNSTVTLGASGSSSGTAAVLTSGAFTIGRNLAVRTSTGTNNATIGGNSTDTSTYSGTITLGDAAGAAQAVNLTAVSGGRVNVTGNVLRMAGATGATDTVTKVGAGTVALAGTTNTYSGTTTVSVGTLLVNGTLDNTGAGVSVASGATLGGNGTINRSGTIANGGILSAGDMSGATSLVGTLAFGSGATSGLTLNNTSEIKFDLQQGDFTVGGTVNDLIAVAGQLTLDGTLTITQLGGSLTSGTYRLFNYTAGLLTNNTLDIDAAFLATHAGSTIDTSVAGQVNLLVVPEPSTWALWTLSLTFLALRRKSRRTHMA